MKIFSINIVLVASLLIGCAATRSQPSNRGREQAWVKAPGREIEDALTIAMKYLREKEQDLSRGYVLQASRKDEYWFFNFEILPFSPDCEISVWVYDSGEVSTSLLAPPRKAL